MSEINNFEAIGIGLASPEKILEWSHGEVKKPETINYRTLKPELDGLFCEKIFGPTKDWECHCGKYKKIRYKGIVCDRCGVEVTRSKVRRERMGHIRLAAPVSHIWYFRGIPSRMGLALDMSPRNLEKILYFAAYIVIDPGSTDLSKYDIINEREYREYINEYGRHDFVAKMGAEAIKDLLGQIDIPALADDLREQLQEAKGQKKSRLIKRLEVIEAFKLSGFNPEWMVLDVLPVLPPELRPMVQLDGGRFATSDLNDLYRRVINRNNRLNKLLQLGAPNIMVRNEKRMLQEAVDALIDNGRRGRAVTGAGNRALKSLSDLLKGKQGRFRQNLLGKRVDYSGRSVIVVGPELKMHQCGLPKEMALELFKPFVMCEIVKKELAQNIKSARRLVERGGDMVWDTLEEVIKDHPVLLNRAPTLHRLGIQAFEPVLVEGRAIQLHPLVCTAYNADFDGDQMAVHVPLSSEAQAEARFLMLASNNLLKPQDGKPVTVPTQDMVMGIYYLTIDQEPEDYDPENLPAFSDVDEANMAYERDLITLRQPIKVRRTVEVDGKIISGVVTSTMGRFIFNTVIPQDLGFVNRSGGGKDLLKLECDFLVGKKQLGQIIEKCIHIHGITETSKVLDQIKAMGFHYSTIGGISIGIFDMVVPDVKEKLIAEAEKKVAEVNRHHQRGLLNKEGRYRAVVDIWRRTTDEITEELKKNLSRFNPVYMMSQSGARGNINQIKQLAGMRGNMADTTGRTVEIPIKSNLREGMNVLEFFISSHGARKSLSDTALKTADSGYLTRRLVDIAQDVIIREEDCQTEEFIEVSAITVGGKNKSRVVQTLYDRVRGRYAAEDVIDPKTQEVIIEAGGLITNDQAQMIEDSDLEKVKIRSNLTCACPSGVCAKCYGVNLATGKAAVVGEAVCIMAAQSIGEPGTQLTMRTFHTGGIAATDDITQGLPRVEELFEARKPKGQAIIAELEGVVKIVEIDKKKREVIVTSADGESKSHPIPLSIPILVDDDDYVEVGDFITDGSVNPQDIMRIKGPEGVQKYIITEVLKVYKNNGVDINDKHIEIIARQMLRKCRIEDSGDTDMLTGSLVDMFDFESTNALTEAQGLKPAGGNRVLLGITKASLATDSFLSAASFQETTRVLTDAAVKGKVDPLLGLKENVIIGKLIPAGSGMPRYRNITAIPVVPENMELLEETEPQREAVS
ncbi:MAG: DNA-directed RNA polymerase subunit beta' [Clostridiaceae bacterium]|nr:DNA-directed RNA polymerase subunit beta' [Clostridiaceae bacterium]